MTPTITLIMPRNSGPYGAVVWRQKCETAASSGAWAPDGQRVGCGVVRVGADVQHRALGQIAVDVAAEQRRPERQRHEPEAGDDHQPSRVLAAGVTPEPGPAGAQERDPDVDERGRGAAAAGDRGRKPPRRGRIGGRARSGQRDQQRAGPAEGGPTPHRSDSRSTVHLRIAARAGDIVSRRAARTARVPQHPATATSTRAV